jgi:hypothetical protein
VEARPDKQREVGSPCCSVNAPAKRLERELLFLTIPTANSRPQLLSQLLADCGLPAEQIILIATRPNLDLPPAVVVEDLGAPNIQRWWHLGIEEAAARGATAVAVANDDLRLGPTTLTELHRALVDSGAAVATPSRPPRKDRLHKGSLVPYSPRIWGSLWMVNVASGLRPDPRYIWWYGDNDLDIRARRDYGGIVSVPVDWEHLHGGEGAGGNSQLMEQTQFDALTFQQDYARLITITRWINRLRSLVGLEPVPF